jgi:2-oxoglutarate ferredoxin oxidoreductase subunit delta
MAKAVGTIVISSESCKGCEICIVACPQKTITLGEHLNLKGYRPAIQTGEGCVGCASCGLICPEGCITIYKEAK